MRQPFVLYQHYNRPINLQTLSVMLCVTLEVCIVSFYLIF